MKKQIPVPAVIAAFVLILGVAFAAMYFMAEAPTSNTAGPNFGAGPRSPGGGAKPGGSGSKSGDAKKADEAPAKSGKAAVGEPAPAPKPDAGADKKPSGAASEAGKR